MAKKIITTHSDGSTRVKREPFACETRQREIGEETAKKAWLSPEQPKSVKAKVKNNES